MMASQPPVLAHGLGGEVGVGARAVPVAEDGLGLEGGVHPEVLGDAEQQPAGHPQLVGDVERREHADLELPLAHHDLGVGALDAQAGVDAGGRVALDDLPPRHLVAAHAAVVRALWGGVADGRPAERPTVLEEGVLLLDPEHRLLVARTSRPRPRSLARVLVGCGVKSVSSTSHMTSLSFGPRRGSGTTNTGRRTQSESCPRAWLVLEPSKPQMPGLLAVGDDLGLAAERAGTARSRRSRCTQLGTAHALLRHFSIAVLPLLLLLPDVPCRPMLPGGAGYRPRNPPGHPTIPPRAPPPVVGRSPNRPSRGHDRVAVEGPDHYRSGPFLRRYPIVNGA